MFKIDKGIPIPPSRYGEKTTVYPFKDMEIWDSFFIPGGRATRLSGSIANARTKYGHLYSTRQVEEEGVRGVRIWRTA
jgi:hypothetical protein